VENHPKDPHTTPYGLPPHFVIMRETQSPEKIPGVHPRYITDNGIILGCLFGRCYSLLEKGDLWDDSPSPLRY